MLKTSSQIGLARAAAAQLSDDEANSDQLRAQKAMQLAEAGMFSSSHEAGKYLDVVAAHQRGETLIPEMQKYLDDTRAFLARWAEVQSQSAHAFARQSGLDALKQARQHALKRLAIEQEKLSFIPGYRAKEKALYLEYIAGLHMNDRGFVATNAANIFNLGVYETFLKKEVIPALEGEVAECDAKIAAFYKAAA